MLDDNDANEISDGGTPDAEGEGYKCVVSFKNEMKKWSSSTCVVMQMKSRVE